MKSADRLLIDEFRDIDSRCAAFSLRNRHRYPLPAHRIDRICRHCEERLVRRSSTSEGGSDEAIHLNRVLDCFATLAMTVSTAKKQHDFPHPSAAQCLLGIAGDPLVALGQGDQLIAADDIVDRSERP